MLFDTISQYGTLLVNGIKKKVIFTRFGFSCCLGVSTNQITFDEHVVQFTGYAEVGTVSKVQPHVHNRTPLTSEFKKANAKSLQTKNYGKRAKVKH